MSKTVKYWLNLCDDDLKTAKWLLEGERFLHCGYFCHQIIEKALKAAVAKNGNEIPPKIHDLQRLAKLGGIFDSLSETQFELIDNLAPLQIEARYPEYKEKIAQALTKAYCSKLVKETEKLLCWIKERLEK